MELDFTTRLQEQEDKVIKLKETIATLERISEDRSSEVKSLIKEGDKMEEERKETLYKMISITAEKDTATKALGEATKTMKRLRERCTKKRCGLLEMLLGGQSKSLKEAVTGKREFTIDGAYRNALYKMWWERQSPTAYA